VLSKSASRRGIPETALLINERRRRWRWRAVEVMLASDDEVWLNWMTCLLRRELRRGEERRRNRTDGGVRYILQTESVLRGTGDTVGQFRFAACLSLVGRRFFVIGKSTYCPVWPFDSFSACNCKPYPLFPSWFGRRLGCFEGRQYNTPRTVHRRIRRRRYGLGRVLFGDMS
jgi:hypothetical protein